MRVQVHAPAALEDVGIFGGGPRQLYWPIPAKCPVVSRLRVIITHCATSAFFVPKKLNCQSPRRDHHDFHADAITCCRRDAATTVTQCSAQC